MVVRSGAASNEAEGLTSDWPNPRRFSLNHIEQKSAFWLPHVSVFSQLSGGWTQLYSIYEGPIISPILQFQTWRHEILSLLPFM